MDDALAFLTGYLTHEEAQRDLHLRDPRAVVRQGIGEHSAPAEAFTAAVEAGFLLPQGDLAVYWVELGKALAEILSGSDASSAVEAAAVRIDERLGG